MKKIALFLLTLSAINFSCTKQVKIPLSYNVTNDALQNGVLDIYIPDTATLDMPVLVKFLTGSTLDSVQLSLTGIPAGLSVSPTTFKALPTYTEDFVFTAQGVSLGNHQLTLTSSVSGQDPKTYNFNIIVLPANSANFFTGGLTTHNACSATDYQYTIGGFIADTTGINVLYINNFGGYGPEANARVTFDPYHGTVNVPQQTIGNGVQLHGSGTYTPTTLTINYTAILTPGGIPDNCTATIVKP